MGLAILTGSYIWLWRVEESRFPWPQASRTWKAASPLLLWATHARTPESEQRVLLMTRAWAPDSLTTSTMCLSSWRRRCPDTTLRLNKHWRVSFAINLKTFKRQNLRFWTNVPGRGHCIYLLIIRDVKNTTHLFFWLFSEAKWLRPKLLLNFCYPTTRGQP